MFTTKNCWDGPYPLPERFITGSIGGCATYYYSPTVSKSLYSTKIGDTYYYDLPGTSRDFVNVEIEDGKLNVTATGKAGEKEYNYEFSVYVGSASDYDIVATFENSILMVELKKKVSKTTIEVKG